MRVARILGLIVLIAFLPWIILTGKNERDARRAIESYEPFSIPSFPFKFSRKIKYDPLGFMGQGRRVGFWEWTPEGLVLAEKGRPYFTETGDEITAVVGAGRRVVTSLKGFKDENGRREVNFRYRWTEITEPASILLSKPPHRDAEYDGRAVLAKRDGQW